MELKEVKNKIGSVKNISELTSALETFSALKMKKTQKKFMQSKPFSHEMARLLSKMYNLLEESNSVFLRKQPVKKILVCVIASDRGFCGPFNSNIFKLVEREMPELEKRGEVEVMSIGKKAMGCCKGKKMPHKFVGVGDYWEFHETKEISDTLINSYLNDEYQEIYLFYTHFHSSFVQKPSKVRLFPLSRNTIDNFLKEEHRDIKDSPNYILEPTSETIINGIVPVFIEYLIYQFILSANTSEHSARMMAMRNASDNARGLLEGLRLEYNKARQEKITSEVCEISSTKEAMG
jgi:F-type H+-transporting ATPase subunit gamma